MSPNPDHEGKRTALATGALLLLPALCCGLPLLIAGGAFAGLGSVLGNPWVIGAAVALLVGVVVWRVRRTGSSTPSTDDGCCAPGASGSRPVPPNHRTTVRSPPPSYSPARARKPFRAVEPSAERISVELGKVTA